MTEDVVEKWNWLLKRAPYLTEEEKRLTATFLEDSSEFKWSVQEGKVDLRVLAEDWRRVSGQPVELSEWIVISGYCATRVVKGTDPDVIANRVAFIEKTPRVKIGEEWVSGPKGSGGHEDPEKWKLYGFDPDSRQWCDDRLIELGYKLEGGRYEGCS